LPVAFKRVHVDVVPDSSPSSLTNKTAMLSVSSDSDEFGHSNGCEATPAVALLQPYPQRHWTIPSSLVVSEQNRPCNP